MKMAIFSKLLLHDLIVRWTINETISTMSHYQLQIIFLMTGIILRLIKISIKENSSVQSFKCLTEVLREK